MISLISLELDRPGFTDTATGSLFEWLRYDGKSEDGLARILEAVGASVWLQRPEDCRTPDNIYAADNTFASRSDVVHVRTSVAVDVIETARRIVIDLCDYVNKYGQHAYFINLPTADGGRETIRRQVRLLVQRHSREDRSCKNSLRTKGEGPESSATTVKSGSRFGCTIRNEQPGI